MVEDLLFHCTERYAYGWIDARFFLRDIDMPGPRESEVSKAIRTKVQGAWDSFNGRSGPSSPWPRE